MNTAKRIVLEVCLARLSATPYVPSEEVALWRCWGIVQMWGEECRVWRVEHRVGRVEWGVCSVECQV